MSTDPLKMARPIIPQQIASTRQTRSIANLYISAVAYNLITLTDGALRAIVLLTLIQLGFSAITLGIMFSIYELMGIFMNFYGGVLGAKYGMRFLVFLSAFGQLGCAVILAPMFYVFPNITDPQTRDILTITIYVICGQMLSGISKDLMKIQGKSVPKLVTKSDDEDKLFRVVSILTGMKNSVKGVGYLFGALLLFYAGWLIACCTQAGVVAIIFPITMKWMENDLGISADNDAKKAKLNLASFKKDWNINVLSLARFFLFGSRDIWFEVAAPYFFRHGLGWAPFSVGGFMAGYTIIYGQLQALTAKLFDAKSGLKRLPNKRDVIIWTFVNAIEALFLGIGAYFAYQSFISSGNSTSTVVVLIVGILIYALLFAVGSAIHSYLIVSYSNHEKVSMDVGFYYTSNAGGRMMGTLASGFIYTYSVEDFGLSVLLWVSAALLLIGTIISGYLREPSAVPTIEAHANSLKSNTVENDSNVEGDNQKEATENGEDQVIIFSSVKKELQPDQQKLAMV